MNLLYEKSSNNMADDWYHSGPELHPYVSAASLEGLPALLVGVRMCLWDRSPRLPASRQVETCQIFLFLLYSGKHCETPCLNRRRQETNRANRDLFDPLVPPFFCCPNSCPLHPIHPPNTHLYRQAKMPPINHLAAFRAGRHWAPLVLVSRGLLTDQGPGEFLRQVTGTAGIWSASSAERRRGKRETDDRRQSKARDGRCCKQHPAHVVFMAPWEKKKTKKHTGQVPQCVSTYSEASRRNTLWLNCGLWSLCHILMKKSTIILKPHVYAYDSRTNTQRCFCFWRWMNGSRRMPRNRKFPEL